MSIPFGYFAILPISSSIWAGLNVGSPVGEDQVSDPSSFTVTIENGVLCVCDKKKFQAF